MLPVVMDATALLEKEKVSAQVMSMHTVKPLDTNFLAEAFAAFKLVVTIEEHSRLGGIGSAIAEWLSEQAPGRARLCRLGTDDRFLHGSGNQANAREIFGLTPGKIAETVTSAYRN